MYPSNGPKKHADLATSPQHDPCIGDVGRSTAQTPSAKPKKPLMHRLFGTPSKSLRSKKTTSVDHADVTSAFCVHMLGMVAAEELNTSGIVRPIEAPESAAFSELESPTHRSLEVASGSSPSTSSLDDIPTAISTPPSSRASIDAQNSSNHGQPNCSISAVTIITSNQPASYEPVDAPDSMTSDATNVEPDFADRPSFGGTSSDRLKVSVATSALDSNTSAGIQGSGTWDAASRGSVSSTRTIIHHPSYVGRSERSMGAIHTIASTSQTSLDSREVLVPISPRASQSIAAPDESAASEAPVASDTSPNPALPIAPRPSPTPASPVVPSSSPVADIPAASDPAIANGILITRDRPRRTEKKVAFVTPDEIAGLKLKFGDDSMSLEDLVKAMAAKIVEEENEKASLRRDNDNKTHDLDMVKRDSEAVAKRATGYFVEMLKYQGRLIDYGADREDQVPGNVAELKELLSKTQDAYQHLEATKKEEFMAWHGRFDDQQRHTEGRIVSMQATIDNLQVQLIETTTSKDSYKDQLEIALAPSRPSDMISHSIAGFQAKENVINQEKANLAQALSDRTEELSDCRDQLTASRGDCGRLGGELEEEKDRNTKLSFANSLLEARAEPIEFIGLPREQRLEMDRKDTELAESKEEVDRLKETMRKMAIAKGKDVDAHVFQRHDHTIEMFTHKIKSLVEDSDEKNRHIAYLSQGLEDDQMFTAHFQEEGEQRQIELNGANDMIRNLRERIANGDPAVADPRVWLHLRECCEGKAQANLRQEQLESELQQSIASREELYIQAQEFALLLWRRIFGLEALVDPSQCPSYLVEGREFIRALTDHHFGTDINGKDPQEDAEVEAQDLQRYGHYCGPTETPVAWLPGPEAAGSQSQVVPTPSDAASVGSSASGSAVPDCSTDDPAVVPPADDQGDSVPDPQAIIARQAYTIEKLETLSETLWSRIWAFEAIVAPEDGDCPARLREEREPLVYYTMKHAGFKVNRPAPEDSTNQPLEFGPFCTPEAWMPREDEDGEGSDNGDDSGNGDNPGDDDYSGGDQNSADDGDSPDADDSPDGDDSTDADDSPDAGDSPGNGDSLGDGNSPNASDLLDAGSSSVDGNSGGDDSPGDVNDPYVEGSSDDGDDADEWLESHESDHGGIGHIQAENTHADFNYGPNIEYGGRSIYPDNAGIFQSNNSESGTSGVCFFSKDAGSKIPELESLATAMAAVTNLPASRRVAVIRQPPASTTPSKTFISCSQNSSLVPLDLKSPEVFAGSLYFPFGPVKMHRSLNRCQFFCLTHIFRSLCCAFSRLWKRVSYSPPLKSFSLRPRQIGYEVQALDAGPIGDSNLWVNGRKVAASRLPMPSQDSLLMKYVPENEEAGPSTGPNYQNLSHMQRDARFAQQLQADFDAEGSDEGGTINNHSRAQVQNGALIAQRMQAAVDAEDLDASRKDFPRRYNNFPIMDLSTKKNKGIDPEMYTEVQLAVHEIDAAYRRACCASPSEKATVFYRGPSSPSQIQLVPKEVPIIPVPGSLVKNMNSSITCYRVQMPQSAGRITPSPPALAIHRASPSPKSDPTSKPTPSKRNGQGQSDPGYMAIPSKRKAPEDLIEEIRAKHARTGRSPVYNKYEQSVKKRTREPSLEMPDAGPASNKTEPEINVLKRKNPEAWTQTVAKHRRTTQTFESHVLARFRHGSDIDERESGYDRMDLDLDIRGKKRRRRRHAPTASSRRRRDLRSRALKTGSEHMDLDLDTPDPWLRMVEKAQAEGYWIWIRFIFGGRWWRLPME